MLETRNLIKIYRPKRGVPVRALDHVSLKFPDRGMIFLLGKSGSGKSTLLNVLGGLDRYDDGEILIKGVSSKNFRQQDFDIYRNTYVGFIFQEYNVLEEFTVGANIALAIELQNRKATDEEINRILHDVDLDGYGDRKPNELSGGQKQRVAIARALIKNPEIIMADEPTGALDSETGRAVFDTLKKLSKDHLVIVVSHDRDFALQYADRIIELADGRVISDLEYAEVPDDIPTGSLTRDSQLRYTEREIRVPYGYRLSEEDREAINRYLSEIEGRDEEVAFIADKKVSPGQTQNTANKTGRPTDTSHIPAGDPSTFRRIKSKLPMKCAFRIGASGLTHKKIRLCVTIFLSCVAFILFGLADTFGSYDHIRTCARSLRDSGIEYATVSKSTRWGEGDDGYYMRDSLTAKDLETLHEETGVTFVGIYSPRMYTMYIDDQFGGPEDEANPDICYNLSANRFLGFSEFHSDSEENFYPLVAGRFPDGSRNEIAISMYACESFIRYGYYDLLQGKTDSDGNRVYETIQSAEDMVGKTLLLGGDPYTVTGVFDSHLDFERYLKLLTDNSKEEGTVNTLLSYAIALEFSSARENSLAQVVMVGEGFIARFVEEKDIYDLNDFCYVSISMEEESGFFVDQIQYVSNIPSDWEIVWAGGKESSLKENDYLIDFGIIGSDLDWDEIYSTDDETEQWGILKRQVSDLLQRKQFRLEVEWNDGKADTNDFCLVGVVLPSDLFEINRTFYGLYNDRLANELESRRKEITYDTASGMMPESESEIRRLVSFCYQEGGETHYPLQNPVTFELDTVHELLQVLSKVFLYIGIGFALFASMMLANFIGTSIAYKKQEIGILRAIGARSNDVFRIFFAESFLIAMINFVLSSIGVALLTFWINSSIRSSAGILITVLRFGPRQVILLFLISIAVAIVASFLPVRRIAAKRPIDAIRNR